MAKKTPEERRLSNIESARRSALKNPEKTSENKRRYAEMNPEKVSVARKAWKDANPKMHVTAQRKSHLKRSFGITIEDYDRMLVEQNGGCAICGGKQSERYKFFDIDHDHITLTVRGLLCRRCNRAIGYFERDRAWLDAALAYLRRLR